MHGFREVSFQETEKKKNQCCDESETDIGTFRQNNKKQLHYLEGDVELFQPNFAWF